MEPISLYIPARNAAATLADCIDAVRRQTLPPDDFFLLVDPRSSDATLDLARASGAPVVSQRGSTLGAARNEALTVARHRWVACCDSDVIVRPDWLKELAARRDANAVAIGGRTLEHVRSPFDAWRALHMPHHWGEYSFRNPFMLVSEVLLDRDAVRAVGGYRNDLNYYEDSDLCQRLREGGYDLLYEPAAAAEHQRMDTLASLLKLRWLYSEHRQKHLLDRYAGLIDKARVNREYAFNTLARCLARGREELAYISYLLFYHHLLMDLRSMLSRRPLISPADRAVYERQLLAVIGAVLERVRPPLAPWVRDDLAPTPPALADLSGPEPRLWPEHLRAVQRAAEDYEAAFSPEVGAILADSAAHCHEPTPASGVRRLPPTDAAALQRKIDALPAQPFVDAAFRRAILARWPDAAGFTVRGPCAPSERAALEGTAPAPSGERVVVLPHLECAAEPLNLIAELPPNARRLVVCYQSLDRLIDGLDVVTPADLASAVSCQGWSIECFDTLVGRIRLICSRRSA